MNADYQELMRFINPVKLKLKDYEIDTIAKSLNSMAVKPEDTERSMSLEKYYADLESRSRACQAYRLYKRLFSIRLTPRDEYRVTFDRSEVAIVQQALRWQPGDNMTVQLLFGKIHKLTI